MTWQIKIAQEAKKDYRKLDRGVRRQVFAGILKVSKNPYPHPKGYGKPLGNKHGNNLTGFFKIKYRDIGIRVVYTLIPEKWVMNILVVSERDDDLCYEVATKLYERYGTEVFKDIFEEFK